LKRHHAILYCRRRFERDGKPDVLFGAENWKTLGVVYGPLAGKDELTVQRMWPAGQEPFAPMSPSANPVLADWDGDGLLDLILGLRERNKKVVGSVAGCTGAATSARSRRRSSAATAARRRQRGQGDHRHLRSGLERRRPTRPHRQPHRAIQGGRRPPWHQKVWVYLRRGG